MGTGLVHCRLGQEQPSLPPFSDTGLWSLKIVALLLGKRLNLGIVSHL